MRTRRRLTIVAVLLAALVPAAIVVVALLAGDHERIVGYFEVARVRSDGRTQVEEVIDYDFGAGSERHGIYRVVPGLDPSTATVSSPSAPDQVEAIGGRLRIGDPAVTISGSHRYEIAYELDTLVQGDRFAWDVVGDEWDVEVEQVEAHVLSDRELLELDCDQGSFGAEGGCTAEPVGPGHLVVRTGPVPSGHAVTVRATLGAPLPETAGDVPAVPSLPTDTGAPLAMPGLLGWAFAAVAALAVGRVLRWAGREEAPAGWIGSTGPVVLPGATGAEASPRVDVDELVDVGAPQLAPPRRLTPAQGGVLLAEKVSAQHQAAWLLGQALQGAVALDGDPKTPTLRWLGGAGAAENPALLTMFDSRSSIRLGSHDPRFEAGWKMVAAELEAWRRSSGLWSPAGERRRRRALAAGAVLVGVGALLAGFLAYRWSLSSAPAVQLALLTVPFGVGAGLLARAWELRVLTSEGSALYVEVEAFRRWLADVEAADVEQAAATGELHDHLAWAVALGQSRAWREAVEGAAVPPSSGYDPSLLLIASSLHRSTSATAVKPSSSGGGGGGGAGGGGGGGGGGSW